MVTDLAGRERKLTARVRQGRPTGADVTAGMVTGLFSIPEGMAYASIAGFNPVSGLYAGVVPPILGSLAAPTVLMGTGITAQLGESAVVPTEPALLAPLDRAEEQARNWIATASQRPSQ